MFAELTGAAQSVQALSSLLKASNGLSNYSEIVSAVSEVNSKLMQANAVALASQEKQSSLTAELNDLRVQFDRLNDWSVEAKQYDTVEIANGVFAQLKIERSEKFESEKKLCTNCFHQNWKSLLQQSNEEMRQKGLTCHRCKALVVFRHYKDAI